MRSRRWLSFVIVSSLLSLSAAGAPPTHPTTGPATWRSYDLLVDLHNLPRRYSCDDLWYKFHDVLLAIGARPDMKILAYRCESALSAARARSPRVQLTFALPQRLDAGQAKWADLKATPATVRLGPGHPASLLNTDCELLRQMKDGLLSAVSQRLVSFNLACAAPHSGRWPFNVTVQALMQERSTPPVVARSSPHGKHSNAELPP